MLKSNVMIGMSHVYNIYIYILVDGIPTPLKNMSSSVGMMKFPIYGKIKNVPNHQPVYIYILYIRSKNCLWFLLRGTRWLGFGFAHSIPLTATYIWYTTRTGFTFGIPLHEIEYPEGNQTKLQFFDAHKWGKLAMDWYKMDQNGDFQQNSSIPGR